MWQKILDKIKELLNGKEMSDADLGVLLDERAGGKDLNWRESVVDFLTLLDIDSSSENRNELAAELGVSPKLKDGSAKKNEALRVAVFRKIAENGGKLPESLTD